MAKNFRLYIKEELICDKIIPLEESQAHYLKNVVKYNVGETIHCFDNKNGEFCCKISSLDKKNPTLAVLNKMRDYHKCPDIWLLFAPLKKDKTDFVIEKATELGCSRIIPVITQNTITKNIKIERYEAQSIEAAEQCRRTDLPQIANPIDLVKLIPNWDHDRPLFYMDETLKSKDFFTVLSQVKHKKAAILIGPEGGFSQEELTILHDTVFAHGATLGPRILRAETAATAALSCWQLICGDWS